MYSIEPTDHWRAGDRAYCLTPIRDGRAFVTERGRIYRVVEARQYRGIMNDGIRLAGVDARGKWGFSSHRFVCLRGPELPIRQLAKRTRHGWYDAYMACSKARNSANADTPQRGPA
jgi:hypothetical protein